MTPPARVRPIRDPVLDLATGLSIVSGWALLWWWRPPLTGFFLLTWAIAVAVAAVLFSEWLWTRRCCDAVDSSPERLVGFDHRGRRVAEIDLSRPHELSFPSATSEASVCVVRQGGVRLCFEARSHGSRAAAARLGLVEWPHGGKAS